MVNDLSLLSGFASSFEDGTLLDYRKKPLYSLDLSN
jgi:hypothetical protein